MSRKIAFAVLFATILLLAPILSNVKAGDADVSEWYTQVDGVLSSDYYYLYPYDAKDLKIGFSKFGEKINPFTGVGLQYNGPVTDSATTSGADPFANPGVNMNRYVEGWWLMFHYQTRTGDWRHLWAFAMFSDFVRWGSPNDGEYTNLAPNVAAKVQDGWIRYANYWDPSDAAALAPHGGRKTNALVVTDPIQIIYEGPRGYIALVSSTIYDYSVAPVFDATTGAFKSWGTEEGLGGAVLRVSILFEFNKVKKEVVQKKDVKLLLENKEWMGSYAYLQFSNRGEWDLGTSKVYNSYVHFYTVGGTDTNSADELETKYLIGGGDSYNKPYQIPTDTKILGSGLFYPYWPTYNVPNDNYAKAQLISSGAPYVGWASYWPHPSFWTVNGFDYAYDKIGEWFKGDAAYSPTGADYLVPLPQNPHTSKYWKYPANIATEPPTGLREDDMWTDHISTKPTIEPDVPFVAVEWDALFDKIDVKEFKMITVYGVTDLHDGKDSQMTGSPANKIDKEVAFQNNEIFNPFDLRDAVEKQELRQVYKHTVTAAEAAAGFTGTTLTEGLTKYTTLTATGTATATWNHVYARSKEWSAKLSTTAVDGSRAQLVVPFGRAMGYLTADSPNTFGFYALVTAPTPGGLGAQVYMMIRHYVGTSVDYALVSTGTTIDSITPNTWTWINPLGPATGSPNPENTGFSWQLLSADGLARHGVAGDGSQTHCFAFYLQNGFAGDMADEVVIRNAAYYAIADVYVDDVVLDTSPTLTVNVHSLEDGKLVPSVWDAYCSFAERVLVGREVGGIFAGTLIAREGYEALRAPYYTIDFSTGKIVLFEWDGTKYIEWKLEAGVVLKVLYSTLDEDEIGRYEWIAVGAESVAVDSAGAAMVSEAFDSIKDIEVGKAGLDVIDLRFGFESPIAYVPFIFRPMVAIGGTSQAVSVRPQFRDDIGRTALLNDFCGSNAIKSSNIIGVGGPLANLESEYLNDFTPAFYGMSDQFHYTDAAYAGKIVAGECWSRNTYGVGHAVISVYKDIDGTVHFVVWGWSGQDTYYACMWLQQALSTWLDYNHDGVVDSNEIYNIPGIVYLQGENPGVVSIILKFDYTLHYTAKWSSTEKGFVTIVERLGTISEKIPHQDP